jgi:hypothetical protein
VIPGGVTSILQPLDISINKPFKESLRRFYGEWMAEGTPGGKITATPGNDVLVDLASLGLHLI